MRFYSHSPSACLLTIERTWVMTLMISHHFTANLWSIYSNLNWWLIIIFLVISCCPPTILAFSIHHFAFPDCSISSSIPRLWFRWNKCILPCIIALGLICSGGPQSVSHNCSCRAIYHPFPWFCTSIYHSLTPISLPHRPWWSTLHPYFCPIPILVEEFN